MFLSKAAQYGLQATLYIASTESGRPLLRRQIARAIDVPEPFLAKILNILSSRGLLVSKKGRNGGFLLAEPAESLTLLLIVEAIDGPDILGKCLLGFPGCEDQFPCPLHSHWKPIKQRLQDLLSKTSVADLESDLSVKPNLIEKLSRRAARPGSTKGEPANG